MTALINTAKDMSVVAEAATGEDGVVKACALKPDLVVIDILLPGINGIEATKVIMANYPEAKILVLSNHSGSIFVQALLNAKVKGYIRKSRAFKELVPAIRSITAGRQYLGQGIND